MVGLHGKDLGSIAEHSGVSDKSVAPPSYAVTPAHIQHAPWVSLALHGTFQQQSPAPQERLRAAHHEDGQTDASTCKVEATFQCRAFKQS